VATVREVSEELNVPAPWIIAAFLPGAMKTTSSELTDDEVAFLRSEAVRWQDDPPTSGFTVF
jgi:hypothetical protein